MMSCQTLNDDDVRNLVVRMREGDEAAADEFVRLVSPWLHQKARQMHAHAHTASDLRQETMLALHEYIARSPVPENALGWLRKVHARRMADLIRRRRASRCAKEHLPQSPAARDPAAEVVQRDAMDAFCKELDQLPNLDQQTVILLRHCGDCTWTQIAAYLEKDESSVRRLCKTGMEALNRIRRKKL